MGTYCDAEDCPKCSGKDTLKVCGDTKTELYNSAVCINCGWGYNTTEFKLTKKQLKEERKNWED